MGNELGNLEALGGVEIPGERFVRDGKIWSAAGVSAGIDLALAFIAGTAGDETAGAVQLAVEYYPLGKLYGKAHLDPRAPAYLKRP